MKMVVFRNFNGINIKYSHRVPQKAILSMSVVDTTLLILIVVVAIFVNVQNRIVHQKITNSRKR